MEQEHVKDTPISSITSAFNLVQDKQVSSPHCCEFTVKHCVGLANGGCGAHGHLSYIN